MSIFYDAKFTQQFPIPLIVYERLGQLQQLPSEIAFQTVLAECCDKPAPTETEVFYFLDRLKETADKKIESNTQEQVRKKSLGTAFSEHIGKLDVSQIILWACGWDYQQAEYWYTKVDAAAAGKMVEQFIKTHQEFNLYQYEAVLYGFGGGYGGSTPAGTVDLSDAGADVIRSLF